MSRIAFISLFLGLISGTQQVDLAVDPAVKLVRLYLADREVAKIAGPPWSAPVDFGSTLVPRELRAVGYDKDGAEVARTSQMLDLPRSDAEAELAIDYAHDKPVAVRVVGKHLRFAHPESATITYDGRPLKVSGFSAPLPAIDPKHSHLISAELKFDDGAVARRELVVAGGFFDTTSTELTAVAVHGSGRARDLEHCFSFDGSPIRMSAVERPNPLIAVVRDPDPAEGEAYVKSTSLKFMTPARQVLRREAQFGDDTTVRVVWPLTREFSDAGGLVSILFEHTNDLLGPQMPLTKLLTIRFDTIDLKNRQRRFADAVAVAGLQLITPGHRRAVILVLSNQTDDSTHSPAEARQYLASIGVPLFVWSLTGPRPDLAASWGQVEDVSSDVKMLAALRRVRDEVDRQEIVWLAADPLKAYRARADARCGVETLAKLQ